MLEGGYTYIPEFVKNILFFMAAGALTLNKYSRIIIQLQE